MTKVWAAILIVAAVGSFLLAAPVIESATSGSTQVFQAIGTADGGGWTRNMLRRRPDSKGGADAPLRSPAGCAALAPDRYRSAPRTRRAAYRRPLGHDPETLDPARISDVYSRSVAQQIFDGLVQFDQTLTIVRRWPSSGEPRGTVSRGRSSCARA